MSVIYDIQTGQTVEVEDQPPSQTQLDAAQADYIRTLRNAKIAETDWWAMADRRMTLAQAEYRQALRDITDQEGFPHNVVWPEKP